MEQTKTFKVILLGDPEAGKDSFFRRYAYNYFESSKTSVIGGVDFNQTKKYLQVNAEKVVEIDLYRTCRQERFFTLIPSYYRRADGILILYDITNRLTTFDNATFWLNEARNKWENYGAIMLIGTKTDLTNERVVSYEEGKQFADENEILFSEVSSKLNLNIDSAIESMAICSESKFNSVNL